MKFTPNNNPVIDAAYQRMAEKGLVEKTPKGYQITALGTEALKKAQSKTQPVLSMTLNTKRGA